MQTKINQHLKRPLRGSAIIASKVADEAERVLCLPRIAGKRCVLLERTIFDVMRRMAVEYDGGLWDFYHLSNEGFYMAPQGRPSYRLACQNMFEHDVSAGTAGIIACAMAYSHLSFLADGECFGNAYQLLSDYIFQHPDASIIRAALD